MRVTILAHGGFPERAKTALGVLRYGDHEVVAVLDRDTAGTVVADHVPDLGAVPIVAELHEVDEPVDALLIGIAPIGGSFDESWRPDVRAALERGCDVIAGLHYFLATDEEFVALADEHGGELWDVREPPEGLGVSEGRAADVDAEVICTVGTDCSVGKMTATMELVRAAREAGYDAAAIPTGQTGIVIEGWGNPIDRVISDFAAGAVEEMLLEKGDEHDYLIVEGQGSIVHPAYSPVTLAILHGAMADRLVLCHAHDREAIRGYESFALPPIPTCVELYESLAAPVKPTRVVAGALNTAGAADDADARRALERFEATLGAPATDPVRFDADEVLEAVLET